MKTLFIAFMLLLFADISQAKTKAKKTKAKKVECALNFKEIHSLLDQKPSSYKSIEAEKSDEAQRMISQVAWLKSGERVRFTSGGCTHFTYSFSYTEFKKTKFKDALEQKNYALKLLEKTPSIEASVLIKALKNTTELKQKSAGIYPLECGEAECTLDLSIKDKIKVNYSAIL